MLGDHRIYFGSCPGKIKCQLSSRIVGKESAKEYLKVHPERSFLLTELLFGNLNKIVMIWIYSNHHMVCEFWYLRVDPLSFGHPQVQHKQWSLGLIESDHGSRRSLNA